MSKDDPIQTALLRAWRLIKDESFRAELQRDGLERILLPSGLELMSRIAVDRKSLDRLGAFDCPVAVNGVYGALSYLSLLRTRNRSPLIFHRLWSGLSPIGVMVDAYELIAIDLSAHVRIYIDQYNRNCTTQSPAGLQLANEYTESNPIFGVPHRVPGFPFGITEAVKKVHYSHYGTSLPAYTLNQFELAVSKRPDALKHVPQNEFPVHALTDEEENQLSTDDLMDVRLGLSVEEYEEACEAENRGLFTFAAERYRVALHHLRPLVSTMSEDRPGAIWAVNNMIVFLLGLRKATGIKEHTLRAYKYSLTPRELSQSGKESFIPLLIQLADALVDDGFFAQADDCIQRADELLDDV